jgi:threonine dehydrogenase-like Zn-dependent dehydrogenase
MGDARERPLPRLRPLPGTAMLTAANWPVGQGGRAMAASAARRVGVIGAGMVGVCAAAWLQRDGNSVFLIEPGNPGEGASFGKPGVSTARR